MLEGLGFMSARDDNKAGEAAAGDGALPAAARRALAEAEARRKAETAPQKAPETGGPSGPEPTRFGDWERNGRAVDF